MENPKAPLNKEKVMAWLGLVDQGTPLTGKLIGDNENNTAKTITTQNGANFDIYG